MRGVDLLDSTAAHVHLQGVLGLATPRYYHLPVVVNERGRKLSKQTGATAVDGRDGSTAATVLGLLGLAVPPALAGVRPGVLWRWALERWSIDSLRGYREFAQRER